jgi:hypothetical protein
VTYPSDSSIVGTTVAKWLFVTALVVLLLPIMMETLRNIWLNYGWSHPVLSTIAVMMIAAIAWWTFGGFVYISTPKSAQTIEQSAASDSSTSWADDPRRKQIIENLRLEYIRSTPNADPHIVSGLEGPPTEWTNQRLQEMGEKWRYKPLGRVAFGIVGKDGLTGFSIKGSKGSSIEGSTIEGIPPEMLKKGYEIEDAENSFMKGNRIITQSPTPPPPSDKGPSPP